MRQLFFWTLNLELWLSTQTQTPQLLNSSVSWWLGVSVTFLLGVPAIAVGLSAISLLASFPPRSKNTEVSSPKSEVRASQRMPLQSLTHPPIIKFRISEIKNLKILKFWVFEFQKSPERTTVPRQVVECKARNPCIYDQTDIKSAEGTTEYSRKDAKECKV